MKHVNRFFLAFLVLCIAFSSLCSSSFAANTSKTSDVKLTTQKVLSSTNPQNSTTDVATGNWTDAEGNLHKNSLKFWVIHGNGYSDSESIKYKLSTGYKILSGSVSASEDCAKDSKMWVNIYVDGELTYESDFVTRKSGPEYFSIDVSGASNVKVECETSTSSSGYCIVDASLSSASAARNKIYSGSGNTSSKKLTSQKVLSSTNPNGSTTDVATGNWTDAEGYLHKNSLKFWVIHGNGYSDSESIKYKLSNGYKTLSGSISASEDCARNSKMWVNIYVDGELEYESDFITRKSGIENFSIDVSGAANVTIECETSTSSSGYCIVDASLSAA